MLRRELVGQLLKAAAIGAVSCGAAELSPSRLRDAGAGKNLLVGSAVSYAELQRPDFAHLLAAQASIVVSENDMKWQRIHPERERFDFQKADALASFASENGQRLRGHNLCWHNQLPAWFKQEATTRNAEDLLRRHIAEVAGHFAGRIHSWDVVNEAVAVEDGRKDGLRDSIWLQLLGPRYIDIAFRAAAEADRRALLTYNDYDLEQDGPRHDAKRKCVLDLLTSLRNLKTPINAIGLQSHLRASAKPSDWTGLHDFLEQVERMDLQVFVTELDVDDRNLPGENGERDSGVARLYREYLTNVLQHRSVKAVLTWGLTDGDTWLNSFNPRKDGVAQRPLPFDPELRPTRAFFAMRDAITGCSPR